VGCHYFPQGLRLPSQPKSVTAHRPVPNYTAWWKRHMCEQLAQSCYSTARSSNSRPPSHQFSALATKLLSHHMQVLYQMAAHIQLIFGFLAYELPFTYPMLCFKEIMVYPKIKVIRSGTKKLLQRHIRHRQVWQTSDGCQSVIGGHLLTVDVVKCCQPSTEDHNVLLITLSVQLWAFGMTSSRWVCRHQPNVCCWHDTSG